MAHGACRAYCRKFCIAATAEENGREVRETLRYKAEGSYLLALTYASPASRPFSSAVAVERWFVTEGGAAAPAGRASLSRQRNNA